MIEGELKKRKYTAFEIAYNVEHTTMEWKIEFVKMKDLEEAKKEFPLPDGVPYDVKDKRKYDEIDLQNLRKYAANVYRCHKKWFGDTEQ